MFPRIVIVLAVFSFALRPPGTVAGELGKIQRLASWDQTPEGVSKSDWQNIRAAYEVGRHAFAPAAGGWQARNPGQALHAVMDERGFTATATGTDWQWGLELAGYGWAGQEQPPRGAQVVAAGTRFTRTWEGGLEEWYVNGGAGIEHGFTVPTRPAALDAQPATLNFLLSVRGSLCPEVEPGGRAVRFHEPGGGAAFTYAGLKVWDADGRMLPARMAAAPSGAVRIEVEEAGARYPLTVDPIVQQAYLKASNTGADDYFGHSVAVSGDTVVVGARLEASNATGVNGNQANNSASQAGAAYVFVRSGTMWTQQAYLKASNTGVQDQFGYSVAVSGDTVVVGASQEASNATGVNGDQDDDSAFAAGAAYVFTRSGTTWTQQAYLKASNAEAADRFGWSVAVSGDTMVVGAYGESSNATGVNGNQANNSASNSGGAYVFTRSGTTWTQQAYLKASNTGASDWFGYSVAVSGDSVLVGALDEDSNGTGVNGNQANNLAATSGAAYVFTRSGTTWTQQAYLKASNTGGGDEFGHSVAVSGDTAVVGARGEDSNATGVDGNQADNSAFSSGAAYVFTRSGTTWTQQAYLKASNAGVDDNFGFSVAVSGDTVVLGAWSEDSNATGVNGNQANNSASASGAAYVFANVTPAEITLSGNANPISNGDTGTGVANHTDFDAAPVVNGIVARTFTITNSGGIVLNLTGTPRVALSGSSNFSVTTQPASATVAANGGSQTFVIAFDPSTAGIHNATVSIANDDSDENPFTFALSGRGLSQADDTDGDGLNDVAEFQMTAAGFDWQISQPTQVTAIFSNLGSAQAEVNAAGYFSTAQVQALHMDVPLLQRDPGTGVFTLTLGLHKSTDLAVPGSFVPFPFVPAGTAINPQGKIEFQFTVPDDAAFFRVQSP